MRWPQLLDLIHPGRDMVSTRFTFKQDPPLRRPGGREGRCGWTGTKAGTEEDALQPGVRRNELKVSNRNGRNSLSTGRVVSPGMYLTVQRTQLARLHTALSGSHQHRWKKGRRN